MSVFEFSLVVPTLNRTEEVRALLRSLTLQTRADFEVIVVDQNGDSRLEPIVEEFAHQLNVSRIQQCSRGASAARNAGIARAQGKILTFPDDDCEYPADLLQRVYEVFSVHPHLDGLSISARDEEHQNSVARLSKRDGVIKRYNVLRRVIEAGIFVKRSSLGDTRFDENMGVGAVTPWWSDEGPDLIVRLLEQGKTFLHTPSLYIRHPDPVKFYDEKAIRRSYQYGCGRGKFLRKNGYPGWFVAYVWGLYVAGVGISVMQGKAAKAKYYFSGLKGRVRGYYDRT